MLVAPGIQIFLLVCLFFGAVAGVQAMGLLVFTLVARHPDTRELRRAPTSSDNVRITTHHHHSKP